MDNEKEISFGAFDSELMHQEIFIPEGFTATIEGDKIILTRKDSEDERIRKELIGYIVEEVGLYPGEDRKEHKWLRWLEKQGEHKKFRDSIQVGDEVTRNSDGVIVNLSQLKRVAKPADKGKPKFNVRDWVIDKQGIVHQIANVIENVTYHTYGYDIVGGGYFNDNTEGVRLWTIQDAKDGDVLYSPCLELLWIFKNRDSVYCGCNLNYNDGAFCGEGYFERPTDAIPATKEQRDTLERAMNDAGWEFDFDKKELKKISQRMVSAEAKEAMYDKPTDEEMKELLRTEYEKGRADAIAEMQKPWSDEDEWKFSDILALLRGGENCHYNTPDLFAWLKSLKERYTWKPKTWEIQILESVIEKGENPKNYSATLHSILEQLKKLKGE